MRTILLGLVFHGLLLWIPISHALTAGDIVDVEYFLFELNTVNAFDRDLIIGAGPEIDCAGSVGASSICGINFGGVFFTTIDFDPIADTIEVTWDGAAGFNATAFNGLRFSQLDTTIGAIDVSCTGSSCEPMVDFAFSQNLGNFITADYALAGAFTSGLKLAVTPVPIPGALLLFASSFSLLWKKRTRGMLA